MQESEAGRGRGLEGAGVWAQEEGLEGAGVWVQEEG